MRFIAKLLNGSTLTEVDLPSVSKLPLKEVVEIAIQEEGRPAVTLKANVSGGESIYYFVRHSISVSGGSKLSVPVYEVRKDGKTLCRLYWHPEKGPILTSQDLYF